MLKEIEMKIFIGKSTRKINKIIKQLRWKQIGKETEEDIYYTSKHKDFIKTEECLRIRDNGKKVELTWKPPSHGHMYHHQQFWKHEIDLQLNGQKRLMRKLLKNLDFIEYVKVKKQRIVYRVDKRSEVMIDKVEPLGYFLEIETKTRKESEGRKRNKQILKLLGFSENKIINIPYRDLVKKGRVFRK